MTLLDGFATGILISSTAWAVYCAVRKDSHALAFNISLMIVATLFLI